MLDSWVRSKIIDIRQKLFFFLIRKQHCPQIEPDHQRVQGMQGQDQTAHETRSLFYDIVIAVVIVIIALLIYRRLTLVSEITSSSPPPAN